LQHTIAPDDLPKRPLFLRPSARVPQRRLVEELIELGYENVTEVGGRGEFARRGGIVDIFPSGHRLPVRVEFFGDEVESLRTFDAADQRTVGPAAEVAVLPAGEFRLPAGGLDALRSSLGTSPGALSKALPEAIAVDLARLEASAAAGLRAIEPGDAAEVWAGLLAPAAALEHVGDAIWVIDEPRAVLSAADFLWAQERERRRELESAGELPKGWPPGYLQRRDFQTRHLAARTLELTEDPTHREAPPGGNVVHVDHGIARYDGIVRRTVRAGADGRSDSLATTTLERDYLDLVFAGADRIYLPVEQIGRISRFSGAEHPQLSKLGGTEWVRTKSRVKKAVDDLAEELLELYSARSAAEGHAFLPDTPWQAELEASFPYEETPDQLTAAAEVKADMERQRPMDRLVVGDVGYGKTEVALRAAFKALQDGTQVAV